MIGYSGSLIGLFLILWVHFRAESILGHRKHKKALLNVIAGIAIAYTFIDVFPHLASKQIKFNNAPTGQITDYLTNHLYLVALFGFCVYVALRVFSAEELGRRQSKLAYVLMVASMCAYGLFVGYMLAEQPLYRPEPALLFGVAMSAHFLGLHHELMDMQAELYQRVVRYLLIASTSIGWLASLLFTISLPAYSLGFAYITGGIVAVGAISDLPRVKTLRALVAFLAGASVFSLMLLTLEGFRLQQ